MINVQKDLPEEQRLDYVLIVTPNHVHFDPAMKAVKAGIPVFCGKAAYGQPQGSQRLVKAVKAKNIPFGVAHTYLGHWTSRFSRYIVRSGLLGEIRWVDSYYLQGWLATKVEATGLQQSGLAHQPKDGRRQRLRRRHRDPRADATALCNRAGRGAALGAVGKPSSKGARWMITSRFTAS